MKRFLVALVVLFMVVGFALWAVVSYRNHVSYDNGKVDSRATRVIRVNVGALTRSISWNVFWNPSFYTEDGSAQVMEKKKMASTGLSTADNLFFFQLGDASFWSNTTFGVLAIDDADVFTKFIQSEAGMRTGQDSVSRYGQGERLAVRYDGQRAVIAFGGFKPGDDGSAAVMDQLGAYLAGERLVNIKDSRFAHDLDHSSHVVVTGDKHMQVDFHDGEIAFSYLLDDASVATALNVQPAPGDDAFMQLRGNLMGLLPEGKSLHAAGSTLHSDSLRHYAAGDVVGEWRGMTTQSDSVIAWVYDDNFDMQETVELVEKQVPDFYLSIRTGERRLEDYLLRQGILDRVSSEINPAFFPLFRVFWQQDGEWLTIHTQKPLEKTEVVAGGPLFYAEADIHAIRENVAIPNMLFYLEPFRMLTVVAEPEPKGTVLRGSIKMEDNKVNSLMQLLVRAENAG